MGIIVSFVFSLLLTPAVVKAAGSFNSPVKDELKDRHGYKKGTCSLGSVPMIISYAAGAFISGDRQSLDYLFLSFPFFLIGFADDMLKFRRCSADGFKSITKLVLQLAASAFAAMGMYRLSFLRYVSLALVLLMILAFRKKVLSVVWEMEKERKTHEE